MRLRSLEAVGFKSFFEATKLEFAPGITAIVGPNGCGKSNLVDAIRWILGEQAPTRLRARDAADLIFGGSASRPPAAMAEVSLTLEADENRRFPPPYESLSEVRVTRRIYRSGDSEYLINRIPCRLRDISEFFVALGINSRGYAIIEQGRVGEIVQARPAELRALIEEAAGLALFRGRREISERKLARVKENLDSVSNVLAEVERQLGYARRQAKKAEEYRQLKAEFDELEKLALARRILALRSELEQAEANRRDYARRVAEARERYSHLRAEAQEADAALAHARERERAVSRELDNLRTAMNERQRSRGFVQQRLAELDKLIPEAFARAAALEEKARAARATRAFLGARLARESAAAAGVSETETAAVNRECQRLRSEVSEAEERVEEIKDEIADLRREGAVARSQMAALERERSTLTKRLAELQQELDRIHDRQRTTETALEDCKAQMGQRQAALQQAEQNLSQALAHEADNRAAVGRLGAMLTLYREQLDQALQRQKRLELDSSEQRLRFVLEALDGTRPSAAPRLLLDVVRPPEGLEEAVRAVLGEVSGAVIAETESFAISAIEILKSRSEGRLSFVPENLVPAVSPKIPEHPGIRGRLLDLLEVEPGFNNLADALLGHVIVAEDIATALAASKSGTGHEVFVTRDGDIVRPGGIMSGGSPRNKAAEEARERPFSVQQARARLETAEAEASQARKELDRAVAAREEAERATATARRAVADLARRSEELRALMAKDQQRAELIRAQRADAERRMVEIDKERSSLNERLEEISQEEKSLSERLAWAREECSRRQESLELAQHRLHEIEARSKMRRAALEAAQRELTQAKLLTNQLEAQCLDNRNSIARWMQDKETFDAQLAEMNRQEVADRENESGLLAQKEELTSELERLERIRAERFQALSKTENELRALEERLHGFELERQRAATLDEELERTFRDRFSGSFEDSEADLRAAIEGRDAEADALRLEAIQARLGRLGAVNLEAQDEIAELAGRVEQLRSEKADLEAAAHDLSVTIQRLSREARRCFAETFEAAAQNFSELGEKLLRGGKARLELEAEAGSEEEPGLRVLVQPAGKKIRDIASLSGGEKALAALALMLALFKLNASPFCVFDEVDAPLDELSLEGFVRLLQEFKSESQFVVVTHNQRTMQAADQIHGVTMAQPGVSQIVSLKFESSGELSVQASG